jgi:hypothetical protein
MRLAGHAALKGETIYAYRILIRILEEKLRGMWKQNIKKKILLNKQGCWKPVDFVLAQDSNQCYTFVNAGTHLRIS